MRKRFKTQKGPTVVPSPSSLNIRFRHLSFAHWLEVCLFEGGGKNPTNSYWQNIKRDVECDNSNYGDETLVTFQRWTLARQQMGESARRFVGLMCTRAKLRPLRRLECRRKKMSLLSPSWLQIPSNAGVTFCLFIAATLVSSCFIWKAWTCCLVTCVHLDFGKKEKRHSSNAFMPQCATKRSFSPLCFQPKAALHIPPFFWPFTE